MALELEYIPQIGDSFRWSSSRQNTLGETFIIIDLKFGGSEILMLTEYDLGGARAQPEITYPWQWSLNNTSKIWFEFLPKSRAGDGLW